MPAVLFNLWNPYRDGRTLTFEITPAEFFGIDRGSHEFVAAALAALGFTIDDYQWQITGARSFYYSDETFDWPDWRDRWVPTWLLKITSVTPLRTGEPNRLFQVPRSLSASDPTWSDDGREAGERYRDTALIIVDFPFDRSPEEVHKTVREVLEGSELTERLRLEPAIRRLAHGYHQLHLLARGVDLPADIPRLETLLRRFRATGAAPDWHWRLTWPEEPPRPMSAMADFLPPWMAERLNPPGSQD